MVLFEPFDPQERNYFLVALVMALVVFIVDTQLPIGWLGGLLYVLPIAVCMFTDRSRTAWAMAIVATVLSIVAVPLKPPGDILIPLFNRPLAIVVFFTVAYVNHRRNILAKEVRRKADELARSNTELQQFAYVASHDLQEPLRMVTAYMALLARKNEGKLDEPSREYIRYATDGATRMRELIDDLLEYSRVDRGGSFKPVDLNEVVDDALNTTGASIKEAGARVEVGPLPTVIGDKTQLGQVVVNLLSNAVKFRGDAPPEVRVGAERSGGTWIIYVKDNGIGIDPRYHDRVFEMFQRLHTKEEYPGTGIGLALVRKIVERHGGRVWVDSEPGKGSTFFFTLPGEGDRR